MLRQFIQYFLVSAMALIVDYASYWMLLEWRLMEIPYAAASGYAIGSLLAYGLMIKRVFTQGWLKHRRHTETILFALSCLLGILLTYGMAEIFVRLVSDDRHGAKLVAVAISFVGVYLFRKLIVFRAAI